MSLLNTELFIIFFFLRYGNLDSMIVTLYVYLPLLLMLLRFFFRGLFLIFHSGDCADGTEENFSRDLDFPWRHGRGGPSVSPLTWGTLTSVAIRVVVIGVWEATFAALRHCRSYISYVVPCGIRETEKKY